MTGSASYSNPISRAPATGARVLAVVAAGLALAGCAGLEKEFALKEGGGIAALLAEPVSEEDVARALERRPEAVFPCRVAVYEIVHREEGAPPESNRYLHPLVEKLSADTRRFRSVAIVTELLLSGRPELLRLRHAASQVQAETLLALEFDVAARSRASPLVFFNLVLVGLFFPSETVEVEVRVQGHLVDTATGYVHGTFRGEAKGEEFVPTLSVDRTVEELLPELAGAAYGRLAEDLARGLAP